MIDYLLDSNVIVRFLTQDDPRQGKAAAKLFLSAKRGDSALHLESSIVAEVVYVLESSYYGKPRMQIADSLADLLKNPGIEAESYEAIVDALNRFRDHPAVDYADCWLAALAAHRGMPVASFDRDFDRFGDIKRWEPS